MSYQPLHQKYRPQTFAQLVGQDAIATTLTNAIQLQRIAPAYLFAGPRGTGKTSSARILAKSLNCLCADQPTVNPCGECEVCRAIASSSSLDVIEIDAASNTGVDNIRTIIESAQFTPMMCRYKVFLIDEAHMLSTQALNALLKTLEEPPSRVVFILATTNPERLLPTIISRTQRFDFRRIPLNAMVQHLKAIAEIENINITPQALNLVAQIASGGLRDAQSLLDQLSLLPKQITPETVWELVGAVNESDSIALIEALTLKDFTDLLCVTRRLVDAGIEPLTILQTLTSSCRELLIALTNPTRLDLVTVSPQSWEKLCELAQDWDVAALQHTLQQLQVGERQLKNTQVPVLWLEAILLSVSPTVSATPATTTTPLIADTLSRGHSDAGNGEKLSASPRLSLTASFSSLPRHKSPTTSGLKNGTDSQLTLTAFQEPHQERQSHVGVASEWEKIWLITLNYLSPLNKSLLSAHGSLLGVEGDVAHVGIKSASLAKIASSRSADISKALSQALGKPIEKVVVEVNP